MAATIRTSAVFLRPFQLASFNEILPAGEYEIEAQPRDLIDCSKGASELSSVVVHLLPRASQPGLKRTLTVPLVEIEHAVARDKLTGKTLTDFLLEEMLADPMIRLVMQADGISDLEIRRIYAARTGADLGHDGTELARNFQATKAGPAENKSVSAPSARRRRHRTRKSRKTSSIR